MTTQKVQTILFLAFCIFPLLCQAAEKKIGTACAGDTNAADWDTIAQCNGTTYVRAPLFAGSGAAYTCSGGLNAGLIQWTGTAFQVCDGTAWKALGGGTAKVMAYYNNSGQCQYNTSCTSRGPTRNGFSDTCQVYTNLYDTVTTDTSGNVYCSTVTDCCLGTMVRSCQLAVSQ